MVYPRVCGGTPIDHVPGSADSGLSPRVRGNQAFTRKKSISVGSIPACAGEPPKCDSNKGEQPVYPRVCGGTVYGDFRRISAGGLSPRVRGNLPYSTSPVLQTGSIPACAGEPAEDQAEATCEEVYPRVCGGTGRKRGGSRPGCGLSPRVRGNRTGCVVPGRRGGSIPACAGEPRRTLLTAELAGVYPRVCGGTPRTLGQFRLLSGLSPRVRGNQGCNERQAEARRSIPACAGEPLVYRRLATSRAVYPRVCGGTW